jgi:hypothetical protein
MLLMQLKHGIQQQLELQLDSILFVNTLELILTAKLFLLDRVLMKYAHLTYSTGMLHQVRILIRLPENTLIKFITLIAEEETDAYHFGVFKAESLSLIRKLLRHIGPSQQNGESLNIRESKSGGSEKLSKD